MFLLVALSCTSQPGNDDEIIVGAEQIDQYQKLIENADIGLCVNHTSLIGKKHLVDTFLTMGIRVNKVFTPEHGFRGKADAGERVAGETRDNFEIISLYGKNKKPNPEDLDDIDIMIFDIQDVGARFYTYISTMHYVMEACAEENIPLIVLDRPNPNGSYIDGPLLDTAFQSFVGMHPIPIVHGLTVGELARMINGEKWLKNRLQCDLTVIPVQNWKHKIPYSLPVRPSPNLPNDLAISLYPSLCLFEGTVVSVGRGTKTPFQVIGHPELKKKEYTFTPQSMEGAKYPKLEGKKCYGDSFIDQNLTYDFNLKHLITYYKTLHEKLDQPFFTEYFDLLAGTHQLREQIINGMSEDEIERSWEEDLKKYREMREKYLLYD